MKRVMVAGATGYLGRHLCAEFQDMGWHVSALVRRSSAAVELNADRIVTAEATNPSSLKHAMREV